MQNDDELVTDKGTNDGAEQSPAEESSEPSNIIEIPEGVLADAQDGDEITGKIITKEDGTRCVDFSSDENEAPEMNPEDAQAQAKGSSKDLVSKLKEMNQGKRNMYD